MGQIFAYEQREKNLFGNKSVLAFGYGLFLFLVPLLPLNQFVVGAVVNALLIKSALEFSSKKIFLLSFIPSTAVVTGGILFGNLTPQILFMIPFIWAGNALLMYLTREFHLNQKKSFLYSTLLAGVGKTTLLLSVALILFSQNLVPLIFLTMFGIIQLVTSQAGAVLVYASKKAQDAMHKN